MADLTQVGVPYQVLLAEYQERVAALTNENIMLRATISHLQQPAPAPEPPAQVESSVPEPPDAAAPGAGKG